MASTTGHHASRCFIRTAGFLLAFVGLLSSNAWAERIFFAGYKGGFYIRSEEEGGMELRLGGRSPDFSGGIHPIALHRHGGSGREPGRCRFSYLVCQCHVVPDRRTAAFVRGQGKTHLSLEVLQSTGKHLGCILSDPIRTRVLVDGSTEYIEEENVVTLRFSIDF